MLGKTRKVRTERPLRESMQDPTNETNQSRRHRKNGRRIRTDPDDTTDTENTENRRYFKMRIEINDEETKFIIETGSPTTIFPKRSTKTSNLLADRIEYKISRRKKPSENRRSKGH